MRSLVPFTLCLLLATGAFAQERTVTVTPVDGPVKTLDGATPKGVCTFGNDGSVAYAITDWIWGQESYATVFSAVQADCACALGFTVEQVHFFMNFKAADVPISFNVSVDFLEVGAEDCAAPGTVFCSSPVYQVNITAAGLYDIALPLGACACANFGYDYAVSINFPDAFPSDKRPDAVTDAALVGCQSFNDYGTGWTDVASFGFPGELILYADIVCCEPPVPTEGDSWGEVKDRYDQD